VAATLCACASSVRCGGVAGASGQHCCARMCRGPRRRGRMQLTATAAAEAEVETAAAAAPAGAREGEEETASAGEKQCKVSGAAGPVVLVQGGWFTAGHGAHACCSTASCWRCVGVCCCMAMAPAVLVGQERAAGAAQSSFTLQLSVWCLVHVFAWLDIYVRHSRRWRCWGHNTPCSSLNHARVRILLSQQRSQGLGRCVSPQAASVSASGCVVGTRGCCVAVAGCAGLLRWCLSCLHVCSLAFRASLAFGSAARRPACGVAQW
jgi:hypothetical protein